MRAQAHAQVGARTTHFTAAGQPSGQFMGPLLRKLAGSRIEPRTRSLRVSSEHFVAQTGWTPRRAGFDASWFDVIDTDSKALQ